MGNIGSHLDLTSGWRGHQAKIEADGALRSGNWTDGDFPTAMAWKAWALSEVTFLQRRLTAPTRDSQFAVGFSIPSITSISVGAFFASSFSPSCCGSAEETQSTL